MKVPVCFDFYYSINGSNIDSDLKFVVSLANYLKTILPPYREKELTSKLDNLFDTINNKEEFENFMFTYIPDDVDKKLTAIKNRATVIYNSLIQEYEYLVVTTTAPEFFKQLKKISGFLSIEVLRLRKKEEIKKRD